MVAQVTATRSTTRTRKPQPPVTVRPLDVRAGLYSTSSRDGHTLYTTDVRNVTCTCAAGQRNFEGCKQAPYCRHMIAAKLVARSLAQMSREARAATLRCTPAIHVRADVVLAAVAACNTQQATAGLQAAA